MAFEDVTWALKIEGLKARERLVLIYLADFSNASKGFAWPSIKTLSKKTGFSQSTVKRAVSSLEEMRLVRIARQSMQKDGTRFSNRYYLACRSNVPTTNNYKKRGDFDVHGKWDEDEERF